MSTDKKLFVKMRRKSKVNEVTAKLHGGKILLLLFGPSLLFVGLISFCVECIVVRIWRACFDPRGATASSQLEVGFDCAKVILVRGKSTFVSEKTVIGGIGKRGPGDTRRSHSGNPQRSCLRNSPFIAINNPPRSRLFSARRENLTVHEQWLGNWN